MDERPLRFGLVGTGYWARVTHAPALSSIEGVELAAVWGRSAAAAADLAGRRIRATPSSAGGSSGSWRRPRPGSAPAAETPPGMWRG
jgi:ornithine cyclodeaminase/alanine dehydrogenase-like protein (mu-crystallin family)